MTGKEMRHIRRKLLKLSQIELGKKIGITYRTISKYENSNIAVPFMLTVTLKSLLPRT